eukprot:10900411-Alexandrium_andersonii.AAC.1
MSHGWNWSGSSWHEGAQGGWRNSSWGSNAGYGSWSRFGDKGKGEGKGSDYRMQGLTINIGSGATGAAAVSTDA